MTGTAREQELEQELMAARAEIAALRDKVDECTQSVTDAYGELERTNQGVVALYAEIDDKNNQLREAADARNRFLRSISHELRTPVNAIIGLTALLLDPRHPDQLSSEQGKQVEFVRSSAEDLLRLVEQLMDLEKAKTGRIVPAPRDFSLRSLLADVHGMIEPLLRPAVRLDLEVDGPDLVRLDPDLLRHVLRNLLSNAAKFTVEGAITVTARVASATGRIEIEVADTGVGITPEHLARIFEEFYQAPSPLQAGVRGTGLGLAFARVVAHAMEGEIDVKSEPGVGSTFRLALPMAVGDGERGDDA